MLYLPSKFSPGGNLKTRAHLFLILLLASPLSFAQINSDQCDPAFEKCEVGEETYRQIYPFKPLPTEEITSRVSRLLEGSNYLNDIREITKRGLTKANTKVQPWGGSYWPLIQGQAANTYQDKNFSVYHGVLSGLEVTSWKYNYKKFLKRSEKIYPKIYDLDERDLAKLAPSEKYDLLLGDTSFDLTNRIWNFTATWGEKKKWGFLSSIDVPAGYRIPEGNSLMALWEGICHGWAVAAGHYDRPEKTVWVRLPNGKKMPFYPNDLKALISLLWANSTIQDNVIVEGLRCNQKMPQKDEFGRYIDTELDKDDKTLLPRCADVHPAVYHTTLVNLLGVEGRSFIVDKKAKAAISNQPVSGYEYIYFNPASGEEGTLERSLVRVVNYKKDPFKDARNRQTKFIVGVEMKLYYIDWEDPVMKETNSEEDDIVDDFTFRYDLELDSNYKIIGGQWWVRKNGRARFLFGNQTNQPDFFWVVPRDYKNYFKPLSGLPEWNFATSTIPPKEYKDAALNAHSFVYQMTKEYGWKEKCPVFPIKRRYGPVKRVDCEFKYPKPQPLINVVNTLLEESRK